MENTKKLTGKDLINVGIYTAMTLVIFFVVGLLTALPVVYPFLFIIWPIVCGIPMMLYYTKIQKFGMLTITGIIGGIFFYLIGYGWIGLLGWVLGGILSDVVLKIGGYQKFKATVLSYACFCLGIMGCPANLWFAGEAYWENIHTSMGDQYANTLQSLMPSWMQNGTIVERGTIGSLFASPREEWTKEFVRLASTEEGGGWTWSKSPLPM